jgi:hypothetical protein
MFNILNPHDWRQSPVQSSPLPIEYVYGTSSFVGSGPAIIPPNATKIDIVPIGLLSFVQVMNQTNRVMPFREIGSLWVHVLPAQMPLMIGVFAGTFTVRGSLLKSLYSYYLIYDQDNNRLTNELDPNAFPPNYLPDTTVLSPNSAGIFFNPYSTLFYYPVGLYIAYQNIVDTPGNSLIIPGGAGMTVAQFYLERCYPMTWTPHIQLTAEAATVQAQVQCIVGFVRTIPNPDYPEFDDRFLYQKSVQ